MVTDYGVAGAQRWQTIAGAALPPPDVEDFPPLDEGEEDRAVLADLDLEAEQTPGDLAAADASQVGARQESKPNHPPTSRPRLRALYVENLKSLAGPHEIPLAPLTLIYGQNSAGKSTVLQALRLLSRAITLGRHDVLHLWSSCFGAAHGFSSLITGHDPQGRLVVGADFGVRDQFARATIAVQPAPHADLIVQRSALSTGEDHLSSKTVHIDYSDLTGGPSNADEPIFHVLHGEGNDARRVRAENGLFGDADEPYEDAIYDIAAHLVDLGPHRGTPGHEYAPAPQPFDFRTRGDYPHDHELNRALDKLDIPYRFETRSRQGRRVLVDTRNEVEVGLDQIGYGVSQLLPVVEACINSAGQVICIEQPELHIHPRLQAKLGSLFVAALRTNNQIIAETHSESILLRVRKLIRRGILREEDVAVIYVDNDPEGGVIVHRLRIGPHGEMLDPWPTGFFDDTLQDILGITS